MISDNARFRHASYNGDLYDIRYLDFYNLLLVDGVAVDEHDDRVVTCAATGRLRLRDRCVVVNGEYFSELSLELAMRFPQLTLGRLLESPEDSDDPTLGQIYVELTEQYGFPLTRAEIRANTHPNIHPGLMTLMIQSSEQGVRLDPYTFRRRESRRRA